MSDHIMPKYRNKNYPNIIVEAVQLNQNNVDAVANWTQSQIVEEKDMMHGTIFEGLNVRTSEGKKRCSQGMYVVRIVGGEDFFVTGNVAFEQLYELLVTT